MCFIAPCVPVAVLSQTKVFSPRKLEEGGGKGLLYGLGCRISVSWSGVLGSNAVQTLECQGASILQLGGHLRLLELGEGLCSRPQFPSWDLSQV